MAEYSHTKPNLISEAGKNYSYQTSSTNMMAEFMANGEKLVPSDDRVYYDKNNNVENEVLDDDIDKYKKPSPLFAEQSQAEASKKSNTYSRQTNSSSDDKKYSASETVPDKKQYDTDDPSTWTSQQTFLNKLDMLRKLGELAQNGVKLSKNYGMNDDYNTMKFEYELHTGIRAKQNAVSWMSGMMIGIVKGMELLNDNMNPFDMKFENQWSKKVTSDITDYYDVLGEIYEKYAGGKKMAPELRLFLMLTGGAVSIQMYKGISNLIPNMSDKIDTDTSMIKNLRQKSQQPNILKEKIEKEHVGASNLAAELHMLNQKKSEFDNINNRANDSERMNNFNNSLILTDQRPTKQSVSINKTNPINQTNPQNNPSNQVNQGTQILLQNQRLLAMQQMMNSMRQSANTVQPVRVPDTKPPSKSLAKSESVDTVSTTSTKSIISINPKLTKIMADKKKLSEKSSSILTDSEKSSELSDDSDNISAEAISFGKKSAVSSDGAKRGRPRKNMQIKIS